MARARARSGAPGLSGFTRGLGWSSLGQGSAFFSGYRTYPLSRAESAGSTSQYLLKTTTIRGSDISIVVGTDAEDRSAGCFAPYLWVQLLHYISNELRSIRAQHDCPSLRTDSV